jgi:hypothetical protein
MFVLKNPLPPPPPPPWIIHFTTHCPDGDAGTIYAPVSIPKKANIVFVSYAFWK